MSWGHQWEVSWVPTVDPNRIDATVEGGINDDAGVLNVEFGQVGGAARCGLSGTEMSCLAEVLVTPIGGGCATPQASMQACSPVEPSAGNPGGQRESAGSCAANSFTPDTLVLMADGSRRPIALVQAGDQVLATDPVTGRTEARSVTALIVGGGLKDLVEVTVDVDGAIGSATGAVVATAGHPFWVDERGSWINAGDLRAGDDLQAPSGGSHEVLATRSHRAVQRVHNLTVDGLQTYYVLAASTPVLVHNCGEAIVHLDRQAGHASITVRHGDDVLHTEQAGRSGTRAVAQEFDGELSGFRLDVRILLPNASRARSFQDVTLGRDLGAYDETNRSCITYCAEVLQQGRVQGIPIDEGSIAITRWLVRRHG